MADVDGSLSGQAVIVTGASAGIGREAARVLASRGANVALAARLEGLAEDIEAEHGTGTLALPTDVTDEDSVELRSTSSRT